MSTIDTAPDASRSLDDASARPNAVAGWATSTDGSVIGRTFVAASSLALLGAIALGVLLGIERIDGGGTVIDAGAIPQLFVAHRVALVYGVGVPLLLGLAIAVVPAQLGARSLSFPRLASAGLWTWIGGLVLVMVSLANNGGPAGGDPDMVDLFLAAHALMLIGLGAAAASVAATVLTARAPGMTMRRVPFFSWSALVASLGLVLVLPVVLGTLLYLFVDHRYAGRTLFGGNIGIGAWIGFALTQPVTYLFVLPAVGVLAELVPITFRRRMPLRGVVYTGLGLVGAAAFAGIAQQTGHEVPWSGSGLDLDGFGDKVRDLAVFALFHLVPLLGVLVVLAAGAFAGKPGPTSAGRPRITAGFVGAFLGVGMIMTGMVGGALLPIVDLGLGGTVFEEAALVYVVYGGVLAALGAMCHWAPLWWGRLIPDRAALGLIALGLVATVLASLPYYVAGFADQPAMSADHDYGGPSTLWNVAVTGGHALMGLVALAFAGLVAKAARGDGDTADDDPWEAHTLEWSGPLPVASRDAVEIPTVMSPEPLLDSRAAPQEAVR